MSTTLLQQASPWEDLREDDPVIRRARDDLERLGF